MQEGRCRFGAPLCFIRLKEFPVATNEIRYGAEMGDWIVQKGHLGVRQPEKGDWTEMQTAIDKVRFAAVPLHEDTDMITVNWLFPSVVNLVTRHVLGKVRAHTQSVVSPSEFPTTVSNNGVIKG